MTFPFEKQTPIFSFIRWQFFWRSIWGLREDSGKIKGEREDEGRIVSQLKWEVFVFKDIGGWI